MEYFYIECLHIIILVAMLLASEWYEVYQNNIENLAGVEMQDILYWPYN